MNRNRKLIGRKNLKRNWKENGIENGKLEQFVSSSFSLVAIYLKLIFLEVAVVFAYCSSLES